MAPGCGDIDFRIGKKFDLTRERIRQIEKKALEKLAKSDVGEVLKSFLE